MRRGQGIALCVGQNVKVLQVISGLHHVAAAVTIPRIGTAVVVGVYIPPVRQGYTHLRYVDSWEAILETVRSL